LFSPAAGAAEDATAERASQAVDLAAVEAKTIAWPLVAGPGNRPYVIFSEPDKDRTAGPDVTGAILP